MTKETTFVDELEVAGSELMNTLKTLLEDASVHRLIVKDNHGKDLFDVPAAIGLFGLLPAAVPVTLLAAGLALIGNYKVEIVRRGDIVEGEAKEVEIVVVDEKAPAVDDLMDEIKIGDEVNTAASKTVFEPDNLRAINGIGPKYAGILNNAGIMTFKQLAASDADTINAILKAAGVERLAKPNEWIAQAAEMS